MSANRLRFPWTKRRHGRRAAPYRDDPIVVFKTFVRLLERLRSAPRGGGCAAIAVSREKP
ncbi:MAG: histidine kinase [Methylocystis sp.]|nr:histidine kinase [Methylocystis sp.]MBI3275894.1 histidine kinase [Methylocystis sp.]